MKSAGGRLPSSATFSGLAKEPAKSIAVLPFVNMSSSEDNEYFSDGMTEEIINALAKIDHLKVTSRTSSFFFKNKNIPIPQIGRELGVATILEGSIRLSGTKMRITAQLIDVVDDFHFWSETFDRPLDDIFAVQDEISLLIADKLREHLGHLEISDHLVDRPAIPVALYQRYLKGRYHILKMNKADLDEGISILKGVITEYPDYALAYVGIHLGYALLGTIGLAPARESFATAQPYLDKAIELDENLPECQLNLSYIRFLQHWDLAGTYRHLNKSLEIRPTVEYYQSMTSTLVAEAQFAAALQYIETAIQLDPLSAINYNLKGFVFYTQEKYDQALACFEKSIGLNPYFGVSKLYLGQTLLLMGRTKAGLAFFQSLPPDQPGDIMQLGGTTLAYAALGDTEQAEAGVAQLEAALQTEMLERAMNFLILCQAMLGRVEETLRLMEQAITYRLPMMVYLKVEPILLPLHANPRFQALMQQVLDDKTAFDPAARKYKKSLLDEDLLAHYRQQLTTLMVEQKPFLDPDLTLRGLAQMLDIPPNHLSQLLNEGFDRNFAEYVNAYRVEAFQEKAADPAQQHLTILALAYDSGFNSKTVFNTFFKRTTGKTPKAYWKSVLH